MSTETCPECGEEYKRVGSHWFYSPDHRPNLTEKQYEVSVGLLMGDGCIKRNRENCYIMSKMISEKYLEYLDDLFGVLGCGVSLVSTADENAQSMRKYVDDNAIAENYSDTYVWRSRSHPRFNELGEWYSSGEKVWPEDIELTPTVLKHWYCGDGTWKNNAASNYIQIATSNEAENTNKVDELFTKSNLPQPSNYSTYSENGEIKFCNIEFTVDQSKELWNYMGDPLPDFEYKWPQEYR